MDLVSSVIDSQFLMRLGRLTWRHFLSLPYAFRVISREFKHVLPSGCFLERVFYVLHSTFLGALFPMTIFLKKI